MKKIALKMKSFVPKNKDLPVLNLDCSISDYYNKNQNYFLKNLQKTTPQKLVGFRNNNLENKLKIEIRKFLKVGKKINNKNIIFGFGSYSILERLAWKFLPKGLMIGEFPQFPYFPMEYTLAGGKYKGIWNKNFSFPKNKILQIIEKNKNLKIIYINNPNNPTGQVYNREEIIEIIKEAQKKNIFVIIDEVYGDLLPANYSMAGLVENCTNLIVVRSFSKVFGLQNLRVGYMIGGKKIISRYQEICNWNEITNIGASLAIAMLKDKKFKQILKKECMENKKKVIDILQNLKFDIVETNPNVPIIFIQNKKIKKISKYFQSKNINVGYTGELLPKINPESPVNYARIRIPNNQKDIKLLKQRLCL